MHVLASQIAGVRLQARVNCRKVTVNIQLRPALERETTGLQLLKVRRAAQQSMLEG